MIPDRQSSIFQFGISRFTFADKEKTTGHAADAAVRQAVREQRGIHLQRRQGTGAIGFSVQLKTRSPLLVHRFTGTNVGLGYLEVVWIVLANHPPWMVS
jgi:hypothetical protein